MDLDSDVQIYSKLKDRFANDGVYGNYFTRTANVGTYMVNIHVEGNSEHFGPFTREISEAFHIYDDQKQDFDGDGLPDVWERRFGLDTSDATGDNGANGDPDHDLLENKDELAYGTNPRIADTDRGGEDDFSEVKNNRDPYDSIDDFFQPPAISIEPANENALISYSLHPNYDSLDLYRSEINATSGFILIKNNISPNGSILDKPLINHHQYWYKMVANGLNGETSDFSDVIVITPKFDVQAPSGFVFINEGETYSLSRDVKLYLRADSDTIQMRISQDSSFQGVSWVSYQEDILFTLGGDNLQLIYVQFQDSEGNIGGGEHGEGIYTFDGIIVDPTGSFSSSITSSSITPDTSSSSSSTSTTSGYSLISFSLFVISLVVYRKKQKLQ